MDFSNFPEPVESWSFIRQYPHLLPFWDIEANIRDGISINLTYGSQVRPNWKCPVKDCHKWRSPVKSRCKTKNGCPFCLYQRICTIDYCNTVAAHPNEKLKQEWHPNNPPMTSFTMNSTEKVDWLCLEKKCHEYNTTIYLRTVRGSNCPICNGNRACGCDDCPSFAKIATDIQKLRWNEDKNGPMTNYMPHADKSVGWKCEIKTCHLWDAKISDMAKREGNCPMCLGRKLCPCKCNSVAVLAPKDILSEWDEDTNGPASECLASSTTKKGWICRIRKCHKWNASPSNRINRGTGCPFCENLRVCPKDYCNSVAVLYPHLLEEWADPEKSLYDYTKGSEYKGPWKCITNPTHDNWDATIYSRTRPKASGCPRCKTSKFHKHFREAVEALDRDDLKYEEEISYSDCVNQRKLPFDFILYYKHHIIRVELQGYQHFDSENHFTRHVEGGFFNRIKIDCIKSKNTFETGYSLLCISYQAEENMREILTEFFEELDTCDQLLRLYITDKLYVQYKNGNFKTTVKKSSLRDEKILLSYQMYRVQMRNIMYNEDFSEENFDTCDCCKKIYSLPFLKYHYRTDAHQELLDIKFPERIGTILNTGEALISAEFNETE